ncbi:FG-GAP-like repeat-containing protein [Cognatiluteimonas profundi]|uniref:FG-GAP-like repeat-containing protein n=1 Tax=Cognatiluteimonas profundi TaxID=2594501 RepID=UPI00131C339A|nr:FG-GAP-like repeat-containing protein [Lysobacter profundi]
MSEDHALNAIGQGGMVIEAPNGRPIRLLFERQIEHADGNWTWVGRPVGAKPGVEALITFGERAVFGSIPNGSEPALQLTTEGGRTWMVETDARKLSSAAEQSDADAVGAPLSSIQAAAPNPTMAGAPVQSAARASSTQAATFAPSAKLATIDLVLGYTTGFATRLGGQSQANTRLTYMVDVANQAYYNSNIGGQLRLVHTVQVDYPDATQNRQALFELSGVTCTNAIASGQLYLPDTGVNCTRVATPAALQPLLAARQQYGADLASLVRTYQVPENQSCGVAWLLGGGQTALDASSAEFGLSVVSDSSGTAFPDSGATCRDETLAHELGHNMGLAHDRQMAAGNDDTNGDGNLLDPEEYGHFANSFGYSTGVGAGNFYTIMSVPASGQTGYRLFSNPRITSCGGAACGVAGQADNAGSLGQTMPIVAAFRSAMTPSATWFRGDFNGDGKSDILWHNASTSANSIWRSASLSTVQAVATVTDRSWAIMGAADFDGDGKSDILWRNIASGANSIWKSANASTLQVLKPITDQAWAVAGAGDFNGDGKADILWRNAQTGANSIWRSADGNTPQSLTRIGDLSWTIAGVGDFDGDHKADILWRNTRTGANSIWKAGSSTNVQVLTAVTNQSWVIVGVGDFNGDGQADILWRNSSTGANSIWKSGNLATVQSVQSVPSQAWVVVGIGDFDGDGKSDILWRNSSTGANSIWKSGNLSTPQSVTTVSSQSWVVAG